MRSPIARSSTTCAGASSGLVREIAGADMRCDAAAGWCAVLHEHDKMNGAQGRHQPLVFACFFLFFPARFPLENVGVSVLNCIAMSGGIH